MGLALRWSCPAFSGKCRCSIHCRQLLFYSPDACCQQSWVSLLFCSKTSLFCIVLQIMLSTKSMLRDVMMWSEQFMFGSLLAYSCQCLALTNCLSVCHLSFTSLFWAMSESPIRMPIVTVADAECRVRHQAPCSYIAGKRLFILTMVINKYDWGPAADQVENLIGQMLPERCILRYSKRSWEREIQKVRQLLRNIAAFAELNDTAVSETDSSTSSSSSSK